MVKFSVNQYCRWCHHCQLRSERSTRINSKSSIMDLLYRPQRMHYNSFLFVFCNESLFIVESMFVWFLKKHRRLCCSSKSIHFKEPYKSQKMSRNLIRKEKLDSSNFYFLYCLHIFIIQFIDWETLTKMSNQVVPLFKNDIYQYEIALDKVLVQTIKNVSSVYYWYCLHLRFITHIGFGKG